MFSSAYINIISNYPGFRDEILCSWVCFYFHQNNLSVVNGKKRYLAKSTSKICCGFFFFELDMWGVTSACFFFSSLRRGWIFLAVMRNKCKINSSWLLYEYSIMSLLRQSFSCVTICYDLLLLVWSHNREYCGCGSYAVIKVSQHTLDVYNSEWVVRLFMGSERRTGAVQRTVHSHVKHLWCTISTNRPSVNIKIVHKQCFFYRQDLNLLLDFHI